MPQLKVLMVCLGNICRSPMAQGVFQHVVEEQDLDIHVDSAGTASYHVGDTPDERTMEILSKHDIRLSHRGQQLKPQHFHDFDFILCMDEENLKNAKRIQPSNGKAKLHLLGEFDPKGERTIEDPYYGGIDGFEHNYQQIHRSSFGFLKFLKLVN